MSDGFLIDPATCPKCGEEKEGVYVRDFDLDDLICQSCRDGEAPPTMDNLPQAVPAPALPRDRRASQSGSPVSRQPVGWIRAVTCAVRNPRIPSWAARIRPASLLRVP